MTTAEAVIRLRLKSEEKERIKRAAALAGTTPSQFALRAALMEAEDVLGERPQFALDDNRSRAFMDALCKSPEPNAALNKLLRTPAPWD